MDDSSTRFETDTNTNASATVLADGGSGIESTTAAEAAGHGIADLIELVGPDDPLIVLPRGGVREVGRSCYQLETIDATYLVDCGINQGAGGQFPDWRGLDHGQVDGVFLTHAHIDHSGALPVLEHKGLLADSAKIVCTQATAALAHVLLHDSLKIHEIESQKPNRRTRFTREDVEAVLDRFEPLTGYQTGRIADHFQPSTDPADDDLTYRFGSAGHLLGSAWISFESRGRRIVFSGDLGGRSAHLRGIDTPPSADALVCESTYGDRHTHPSLSDARTKLFEHTVDAVEQDIPVLIPAFAVGRAQEILQVFRERWDHLSLELQHKLTIIYDGLARDATDRYHAFAGPEWLNESIMNYIQNSSDFEPFVPPVAKRPESPDERQAILSSSIAPVIVCPSGMLTGGLAPAYLLYLREHYDEARVLFTGYQATGTLGHDLQNGDGPKINATINTWQLDEDFDRGNETPSHQVEIPTHWIRTVDGFSGHAASNRLLEFARDVSPESIALVHGEPSAQQQLADYFERNTTAGTIGSAELHTPISVHAPDLSDIDASDIDSDQSETADDDDAERTAEINDQDLQYLDRRIAAIEDELVAVRNDDRLTERELREIVRDELSENSRGER